MPAAAQDAVAYTVELAGFDVTGVSVYEPEALLAYAANYLGQTQGSVSPDALADIVERLYREDGYFLAEAKVGPDGRTILVDEGSIGTVEVEGVDEATFARIRAMAAPLVSRRPVRQADFERAVMLADDIENLSVAAEIDYPDPAGPARLRLIATEGAGGVGSLVLDNPARRLGKTVSLHFAQDLYSLAVPGDYLTFGLSANGDIDGSDGWSLVGSAAYRLPAGPGGGYVEAFLGNVAARRGTDGQLVQTDLDGSTAILAYGYPVIRNVDTYGYALGELRLTDAESTAAGATLGSQTAVGSLSWIYGTARPSGAFTEYAVSLLGGRRLSDLSPGQTDGEENFWFLRAGFGHERPLDAVAPDTTLRLEFWGQYTPHALPVTEEMIFGSKTDERGYAFDEADADSGLSASIEIGRDFWPESGIARRLRPFGFVDGAIVRNNAPAAGETGNLSLLSAGLGIEAELQNGAFFTGYAALPLRDGPRTARNDAAIYISVGRSW
jgi:hemolysin activation/secretion protein